MAIFLQNNSGELLSEEELEKVNGGQLYIKDGVYLYSDAPELAGKKYRLLRAIGTGVSGGIVLLSSKGTDAETIQELLAQGFIFEAYEGYAVPTEVVIDPSDVKGQVDVR